MKIMQHTRLFRPETGMNQAKRAEDTENEKFLTGLNESERKNEAEKFYKI